MPGEHPALRPLEGVQDLVAAPGRRLGAVAVDHSSSGHPFPLWTESVVGAGSPLREGLAAQVSGSWVEGHVQSKGLAMAMVEFCPAAGLLVQWFANDGGHDESRVKEG